MNRIASSLSILLLAFAAPQGFGAGKDSSSEPAYDQKTEVQIEGVVGGVREVSTGALQGVYLTVKAKSESIEVYLAPADFIEMIDMHFKTGAEVQVIGSKVKFEDRDLVLARELTVGKVIVQLRDAKGTPNWLWKKQIPTGL